MAMDSYSNQTPHPLQHPSTPTDPAKPATPHPTPSSNSKSADSHTTMAPCPTPK